jgi:hypothetical protein
LLIFSLSCTLFPQIKFLENGQPSPKGNDAALFFDSPSRMKIDLSGQWRYSVDGGEWSEASVPSGYDAISRITFVRNFEIKSSMLDAYTFQLVAYGINYQSEVTLNGTLIGRHLGGYSSFIVPIPANVLQAGSENVISILVDNELTPKTTLPLRQQVGGWRSYGGITRDLFILATPKLFIDDAEIKYTISQDGRAATLQIKPEILDRGFSSGEQSGGMSFVAEAYHAGTDSLAGRSTVVPLNFQKNKPYIIETQLTLNEPKLWSPEFPDLYVVKCKIIQDVAGVVEMFDEFTSEVGLRQFTWKAGELYINNNQTMLKGILYHEDHPSYGSALTYDVMKRDIVSIKSLGANLVRFPYPPHPYLIRLCDQYGLLVMEDIPLVGVPNEILLKDYFQEIAVTYLKEMVGRDKQHASLLAWGIGDDFEIEAGGKCEYVSTARGIIKSLDERPVYFASHKANEPCFEFVDMIAVNGYETDVDVLRNVLNLCRSSNPNKPIVLARYGKTIEKGNRNGYSDPRSLEAQGHYIKQCVEVIRQAKIAGGVLWAYSDWRGDRPALTTYSLDPYMQTMGIVSYEREKRVAFDVVRSLYSGDKVQALSFGKYSPSAPIIYVVAGLVVLIGFAFFYNGNRRFRESVNRALMRSYNFFADIRDQRVVAWTHSIVLVLVYSVTWSIILSSVFTHYRESVLLDNMLSQFLNDTIKEWFVRLVWMPSKFILMISLLIAVKIVLLAVFVRACAVTVRAHVHFYHAFSVTMWSLLPYIVLIPIAMVLYRLMENPAYVYAVVTIIFLISVWVFLRLLKGISIIYDVKPMKVYGGGVLLLILCVFAVYAYFDYTQSTSIYLKYLLQSMNVR